MKTFPLLATLSASLLAGGCAAIAVTDEAIVDRTAFALGLAKGDFTISNRMDDGAATRYQVRVNWWQDGRRDIVDKLGADLNRLGAQSRAARKQSGGEGPIPAGWCRA
mgnify:CR=1 FL=1